MSRRASIPLVLVVLHKEGAVAQIERGQVADQLQQRNREIGDILAEARRRHHRSVTECANAVGTSRRRYNAIEQGEAAINAGELELMVRYLEVPAEEIWRDFCVPTTPRPVVLQVSSGQQIQFVVEIKDSKT
jgi:DNA-binding XRE family transcriptional regulator